MRKYVDFLEGTDSRAIAGASVLVSTYPGNIAATLYADEVGTPLANPVTTDATGEYWFYAANGRYTLQISGTGLLEKTISDVAIYDPADELAAALAAGESASAAASSASASASSASAAATSATAAAAYATAASASASAAATSETNAANSAIQAEAASRVFSTTTLGIAGTSSGQYFAVKQTYGASADVYLNSAGTAVLQSLTVPIADALTYQQIQVQERSTSLVAALPYTAYVDVSSIDAYPYDGRGVPNRRGAIAMPRNVFHFSTGEISGNDAGLSTAPTQRYVAGPQGNVTAKRLQIGTAEVYDLFYNPTSRVLPAGQWTLGFQIKNNIAATHAVKYGVFGAITTGSCNNTFAQKTVTFTSDGIAATRLSIFTDGVQALDVSVDEFQLYQGTTLPAFSAEASIGGHLRALHALQNSVQRNSANGAVVDTNNSTPAHIRVGTPAAGKAFTEGAFFAVVQTDRSDQNYAKVLCSNGSTGTWDIAYRNGSVGGKPALDVGTLAGKELYVTSKGYRIVGAGFKSGQETFWFDNIPYSRNTSSLGTQTLNNIGVFGDPYGGGNTPGNLPWKGKCTKLIVLDQYPTDTQVDSIVSSLAAQHAMYGEDPVHAFNYVIGSGDSQTQSNSLSAQGQTWWYDFFDSPPATNWHGKMLAVSGTQLNAGGNSGYSFLPTISEQVRAALARGHRPIVTVLFGANGVPTIADLVTFWDTIRGYGAKVIAMTVLPKNQDATFETNRLALNVQIRANSTHYDGLADIGGDATIGAFTAPGAGGVETTYYKDGVHLKAAGNAIVGTYVRPLLISLGL